MKLRWPVPINASLPPGGTKDNSCKISYPIYSRVRMCELCSTLFLIQTMILALIIRVFNTIRQSLLDLFSPDSVPDFAVCFFIYRKFCKFTAMN